MTEKGARDVAIISTVLAGYLLIAGIAMWSDAPTPAEGAVGRGLVVLAVAVGFVACYGYGSWATAWDARLRAERSGAGRAGGRRPGIDWYTGDSSGSSGPAGPGGPAGS